MSQEIERKFFVRELPDLNNLEAIKYERCFLFIDEYSEIRIQKKRDKYELERKTTKNSLEAKKQRFQISQEEYERLKRNCEKIIKRTSYNSSASPKISIKVYSGDFIWLTRVEVEFSNKEGAYKFMPLEWFGKEITSSPLWRDSKLVKLHHKEFLELIHI